MMTPSKAEAGVSLQQTFEAYLARLGRTKEQVLGPRQKASRAATAEDAAWLKASLREVKSSQRRIYTICIVVLCVIFTLQVGLLLHSALTKSPIGGAVGGGMVIFWPILRWLRRLWIDSFTMQFAEKIIDELPPEQQVKMIEILYWGAIPKGKRPGGDK